MRQLAKLSVVAIVISTTSGCGWLWGDKGYFRNRSNDYLEAKQTSLIIIPSNLQAETRPFDPLYPIPYNVANSTAGKNYQVPRPVPLQIVNDNNRSPSLQNNQGRQWFIAQQSPMQIYGQVLQYFRQTGFHIDTTQPEIGEFTTDWIKPNALTNQLSNRLLAIDSSLVNQQLRVKARVESGVQSNTSEVYTIVMVRPDNSTADIPWPVKSQSISVESVLLDELMANLSNTQVVDNTVSLLTDANKIENTSSVSNIAILKTDNQNLPILVMNGDVDLVWVRVEQAITAANIKIDDMDRSTNTYYINLAEKADGSSEVGFFSKLFGGDSDAKREARAERYIIKVEPSNNEIHVRVLNAKDSNVVVPADKAEAILKQLKDKMN